MDTIIQESAVSKETEWRELICSISGVLMAKPMFDENGLIKEIHILADDSRSAKQLVRDVQSALIAKFDEPLDHRIISVAQVPSESSSRRPDRLRYHGVSIDLTVSGVTVSVELSSQDTIYKGVSSGRNTQIGRQRIIALAAIDAIDKYLGSYGCFELLEVAQFEVSGKKLVHAIVFSELDQVFLVGSVFVSDDLDTAIVKAILDAVNRRLYRRKGAKQAQPQA